MKGLVKPQLLLIYNNSGTVKRSIFLSEKNIEEIKTTQLYELYKYYKEGRSEIFENSTEEVFQGHILLTLNLMEAKSYIANNILNTKKSVLLFSLFGNFDYYNNDGTLFVPFNINKPYSKNSENIILYEAYPEIILNNFFCILEDSSLGNFYNTPINKISNYIEKLFNTIKDNKDKSFKIWTENNISNTYDLNNSENYLYDVSTLTNVKKNIIKYFYDKILISGDNFYYKENRLEETKKNKPKNSVDVYRKDKDKMIFTSTDNIIKIIDSISFTKILSDNRIDKYFSKEKKIKNNTIIYYNVYFKEILFIDYETDFFLENTIKTKNIFIDRSHKINIMMSSDHIIFASFYNNLSLFKYLTEIIITMQMGNNLLEFIKKEKKYGNRYLSRYCQGNRSPIDIESEKMKKIIEEGNFEKYSEVFYKEKNDQGDIYKDIKTDKYYTCNGLESKNIGFITEIYEGYNICVPCCYKKNKTDGKIFKECVLNNDKSDDLIVDNYVNIFKQYRIIIKPGKIGFLIGKLDQLLNIDSENFLQNRKGISKVSRESFVDKKVDSLKKMGINKYGNTNIFLSKNNNDEIFYSFDDGTNVNDYSYSFKNNSTLKKEVIYTDIKQSKIHKKFSSIYEKMSDNESFAIINNQNRLELAKNYVVYFNYKDDFDFIGVENLEEEGKIRIYIIDDVLFFNNKTYKMFITSTDDFYSIVELILVIQKKNHILKIINKKTFDSEIVMEDLGISKKKFFLKSLLKNLNNFSFDEKNGNITYTQDYTEVMNKRIYNIEACNTKYFFELKNFLFNPDSLSHYITDVMYRELFAVYTNEDDKLEVKKIFLNNLDNYINMNVDYNLSWKLYPEYISKSREYVNRYYEKIIK